LVGLNDKYDESDEFDLPEAAGKSEESIL